MKKKLLIILTIFVGGVAAAAGTYFFLHKNSTSILAQTQKKVGFTLFVPSKTAAWKLDTQTIVFDSSTGVVTFTLNQPSNTNKIVVSEQATPDPFTDIPNYSAIFFNKLNAYQELNVGLGKATLTRPTELKGGQSAVMNTRGTLMFLHPDKDLSDDDWKIVFQGLQTL